MEEAVWQRYLMACDGTPCDTVKVNRCTAVFKRCGLAAICCKVNGGMKNDSLRMKRQQKRFVLRLQWAIG